MSIIKSDPDGSPLAEPSLKGNIVPDAKNTKKLMVLPWRPQLKPLFGSHHLLLSLKEFGVKPDGLVKSQAASFIKIWLPKLSRPK